MQSPLFLLTCTFLGMVGFVIPFFTPIFLFGTGHAHWAWICIAASIISTLINTYLSKLLMIFQFITKVASSAHIVALAYHTILLLTILALAPSDIWWVLVLATWEIARYPLQDILTLVREDNMIYRPTFYNMYPIICEKTLIYSSIQIYITGYASIVSAIILLLK